MQIQTTNQICLPQPKHQQFSDKGKTCEEEISSNVLVKTKSHQPLSWGEQVNSKQVKIIELKQPTPANQQMNEINSHAVIFHDKEWIEEMLKKRSTQLNIASYCLPQFHVNKENTLKITEKRSQITERRRIKDTRQLSSRHAFKTDELELRGRGMDYKMTDPKQFSSHEICEKNSCSTIDEIYNIPHRWNMNTMQQGIQRDCLMISENINATTTKPRVTSPKKATDENAAFSSIQLKFNISVSLPNATYGEELTKDCQISISELNEMENQKQIFDVNPKRLHSRETIVVMSPRRMCAKLTSRNNTKVDGSTLSIAKSTVENVAEYWYDDKHSSKNKFRKSSLSANSCPNLLKFTDSLAIRGQPLHCLPTAHLCKSWPPTKLSKYPEVFLLVKHCWSYVKVFVKI